MRSWGLGDPDAEGELRNRGMVQKGARVSCEPIAALCAVPGEADPGQPGQGPGELSHAGREHFWLYSCNFGGRPGWAGEIKKLLPHR